VAIGAVFLLRGRAREEGLVHLTELIPSVALQAKWIVLLVRVHDVGRRDVVLVGAVRGGIPVAILAADVGFRVEHGKLLFFVVHMANVAAAVVGDGAFWHIGSLFSLARLLQQ